MLVASVTRWRREADGTAGGPEALQSSRERPRHASSRSRTRELVASTIYVSVYSGPEPPSGGVSRPPLAVIAPHWTQFDGLSCTVTVPSPSAGPTS